MPGRGACPGRGVGARGRRRSGRVERVAVGSNQRTPSDSCFHWLLRNAWTGPSGALPRLHLRSRPVDRVDLGLRPHASKKSSPGPGRSRRTVGFHVVDDVAVQSAPAGGRSAADDETAPLRSFATASAGTVPAAMSVLDDRQIVRAGLAAAMSRPAPGPAARRPRTPPRPSGRTPRSGRSAALISPMAAGGRRRRLPGGRDGSGATAGRAGRHGATPSSKGSFLERL